MRINVKLLIGGVVISSLSASSHAYAYEQEPASWSPQSGPSLFQSLGIDSSAHQARSHIVTFASKPLLVVENTDVASVLTHRSKPLSASPPFADKTKAIRSGSISPLAPPVDPNYGRNSGEMEPLLQMASLSSETETAEIEKSATMMPPPVNHWAYVLTTYTSMDAQGLVRFDYGALQASKADMALLADYIEELSQQKPSTMARQQAMAYWANLYNALTVQVVAQNYPVKSIREIKSGRRKGPWRRKLVTIEGELLTLDNIEHDILRPTYKSPLVHYMVNCASVGCPNLKTSPWQAETLQEDMEAAARAYINSSRGVRFDKGKMKASKIYRWFKKDFGNSEKGVLAHLRQYADADLQQKLETRTKIGKYEYDWALNAP